MADIQSSSTLYVLCKILQAEKGVKILRERKANEILEREKRNVRLEGEKGVLGRL